MAKTKSLSTLDMAFFVLENDQRMSNVGPLVILKPPPGTRSAVKYADRLLAAMLKRPVGAPFNLRYVPPGLSGMPHLAEDSAMDLDKHCERLSVPAPGTDQQLFDMVCRLHEQRLPRSRPTWAMYVIDGLQDGRIALYAKVNHGLVDGRGFVELFTRWFSTDPADRQVRALWEGLEGPKSKKKEDAAPRLDVAALTATAGRAAKSMSSLYSALGRQTLASLGLGAGFPLPFFGTPSVLVAKPSLTRCFSYCVLPLAEVKTFSKAHEVSVNDVLLTVLDMALNRYLTDEGVTQARKPLVADMPVALGNPGGGGGNAIAVLQIAMGDTNAEPLERLAQVRKHSQELKDYVKQTDRDALVTYTTAVHTLPAVFEMVGVERQPMLANLMISNPFGLPERRYLAGAELEMALPVAVLAPGQTLNITAATYDTGLQIAFLALEAVIPDVQRLADYTVDAFQELLQADQVRETPPPAKAKRAAPRATKAQANSLPKSQPDTKVNSRAKAKKAVA